AVPGAGAARRAPDLSLGGGRRRGLAAAVVLRRPGGGLRRAVERHRPRRSAPGPARRPPGPRLRLAGIDPAVLQHWPRRARLADEPGAGLDLDDFRPDG